MGMEDVDDGLDRAYSSEEGGEALLVFLALALRRGVVAGCQTLGLLELRMAR